MHQPDRSKKAPAQFWIAANNITVTFLAPPPVPDPSPRSLFLFLLVPALRSPYQHIALIHDGAGIVARRNLSIADAEGPMRLVNGRMYDHPDRGATLLDYRMGLGNHTDTVAMMKLEGVPNGRQAA